MNTMCRFGILAALSISAGTVCVAQTNTASVAAPQPAIPAVAAQGQPQAQSACGNQPLCTDTPDFTATVTDFRMTNTNGIKVMDVSVRFQNKTSDTLILGYEDRSEMAMDEQGNRYAPNPWGNAYRGIGVVSGNNMDPKFALRPGSWGDASFELVWRPGAQDPIGSTFEYALSVREINTLAGNQHSLGGEFPLHFQGLANGVRGVSPGYSGSASVGSSVFASGQSLPPCGAAGALSNAAGVASGTGNQTATNAASQVSNAASTISSLGALFRRKQAASTTTTVTSNGAPCAQAQTSTTTTTVVPAAVVNGTPANANVRPATPSVAASPAAPNSAKVVATSQNKAAIPAATTAKAPAVAARPITPAARTVTPATKPAPTAATSGTALTPAAVPPAKKPAPAKPDLKKPAQK
jgi:hypothetical protein